MGVWYWSYSYGLHVRIKHVNGYYTTYNHLSHIYVHTGQHVDRRQVIGLSGSSGHSTGPHLHFEIWRWMSATVNPAPWIW